MPAFGLQEEDAKKVPHTTELVKKSLKKPKRGVKSMSDLESMKRQADMEVSSE